MSELINNSEKRKELLKHMILQLHAGEAPDMVKARLAELLKKVPYDEVVEVEQELISEGLPTEEVMRLCDIHSSVLEGHIDLSQAKIVPPGHPVDTFKAENRELSKVIAAVRAMFTGLDQVNMPDLQAWVNKLHQHFNNLGDVDKHYKRKEYLLFPFLEKYGITGPPTVMWGKHDETRGILKVAQASFLEEKSFTPEILKSALIDVYEPALKAVEDMIMKEEEILLPMCMDKLNDIEWYQIYSQTIEFGYCLYDPAVEWKPDGMSEAEFPAGQEGFIQLPSGNFTLPELTAIFNTMPIDITFVDKDDKVRFFSMGPDRIFPRNRAILGRDVRLCHPPGSVHIVEQILSDFKAGKESAAPFWIELHGKFLYITYHALRDKEGAYLGTLEFSQDLTPLRALKGEQRLLSYESTKKTEVMENAKPEGAPAWFDSGKIIDTLDAREMIARGEHPLTAVMQKGDEMKQGEIYLLITPFPPHPLVDKMKDKGFDAFIEKVDATTYKNYLFKAV
jgi:hypothetical protein